MNLKPFSSFEIVIVKIIKLFRPIMTSKQVHVFLYNCARCSISRWGWFPCCVFDLSPWIWSKVESVEIILVMAIIASKDVHWVLKYNCWMRMTCTWRHFMIMGCQNFLPRVVVNVVLKEIIHSVKPIIAPKNEDRSWMNNWNMSITGRRRHVIRFYFSPSVRINIIAVKIILTSHSIIAPKDVNLIFKANTWMKRSLLIRWLTAQGMC